MPSSLQKLSKFALVGILSTLIHVVIATFFITQQQYQHGYANVIAFLAATSFSYIANTIWSFADRIRYSNFIRFVVVAVIGSVLAYLLSTLAEWLGFHYLIGIGFIVVCVPALSFLAHNFWTYKEK